MFNFFKRKGKAVMLTDEQIQALTSEQRAELLTKLQQEVQPVVEETIVEPLEEVEVKPIVEETVVVEESVVVEQPQPSEIEIAIQTIETKLDAKITEIVSGFEKKLAEKEALITALGAKVQELERTAPMSAPQRKVQEQEIKTPEEIKKSSIVSNYYGRK